MNKIRRKRFTLDLLIIKNLRIALLGFMAPWLISQSFGAQTNSANNAFNFINSLVLPIKGTDDYLARTNIDIDDRGDFEVVRMHLYSNAIAAIVLTHRGVEQNDPSHLDKVAGIFRQWRNFQYTSANATIEGAFPNMLITEDYHAAPGFNRPYCNENSNRMVRHGNNAWYLMALGYYTLATGDRQFVPQLEKLADYLTSIHGQDQTPGSPTEGGIYFGWGNYNQPINVQRNYFATEHQTESFAGLLYAAEVIKDEANGAVKQQHYLECAYKVLRFAATKLFNPNNPAPGADPKASFFHVGLTKTGAVDPGNVALDAQTWSNLAFGRALQDVEDITGALDYAWEHMYGDSTVDLNAMRSGARSVLGIDHVKGSSKMHSPVLGRGAVWYEGDKGIWLTGSAQLAYAYDYIFNHLNGDETDLKRGKIAFDDMSKMEWLADEITISTAVNMRTYSWPRGGFSCFSDKYNANTEPSAFSRGETYPHIEPTVWRYFDINDLNPYAIDLSVLLAAPDNLTAAVSPQSIKLTWDMNPMAVSYIIMRDGTPIAAVNNLDNISSTLSFEDIDASGPHVYAVAARDMSGNLGEVSNVTVGGGNNHGGKS